MDEPTSQSVLIADAVEGYFVTRGSRKDSTHTTAAYRSDIAAITALLAGAADLDVADLGVDALTLPAMRRAFNDFAATREPSSIRRAWSTWNGLFNHLVNEQLVAGNPMAGVARPAAPVRTPRSFAPDATERIIEAIMSGPVAARDPWPEHDLAIVFTLLLTGVRSAELRGLDVRSLAGRDDDRRLVVRGKGDSDRTVPVEPGLVDLLATYQRSRLDRFPDHARRTSSSEVWAQLRPDAPMFVGRDGERLTRGRLQYLVQNVYRRAGVESERQRGALVHALRHTFATRLAENPEVTIVQLMEVLGHRSMATTQNYVKAAGRQVRSAVASNPVYDLLAQRTDA